MQPEPEQSVSPSLLISPESSAYHHILLWSAVYQDETSPCGRISVYQDLYSQDS